MRAAGRAKNSVQDEEFLQNLYKGGELLAAGKVIEAKDYLERAYELQPKNEKGQNLLGLAYFKLGLFDRAAEIYEALVRENPVDPTLRVNLGLVYLKTNAMARAIREFETSCDLAPDHKKAHNYLGLALAQLGNYAEAKDHFIAAGSDAMAQKMERALSGEATGLHRMPAPLEQQQKGFAEIEGSEVVAERGGQQIVEERARAAAAEQPGSAPAAELPPEVEVQVTDEAPPSDSDWGAQFDKSSDELEIRFAEDEGPSAIGIGQAAPGASEDAEESVVVMLHDEEVDRPAEAEQVPPALEGWQAQSLDEVQPAVLTLSSGIGSLAEMGPSLEVLKGAAVAPFEVREEGAAITVTGELLTRIEGLLVSAGSLRFEPELKRFRGRSTDQSFGEGASRMMRASGQGVMVVAAPEKQRFVALELGEESAYFREDAVYAFEEPVMFENGRVPSDVTGDLDLVHLRGNGKVLIRIAGTLRSHQVRMDQPAVVPLARLVGWFGNVTPRLVPLAQEESGALVEGGVELSGEGFVLFSAAIG